MKNQWILPASLLLLTLASLVSCNPGVSLSAEDGSGALSTQVSTTGAAAAAGPMEAHAGITPPRGITENTTMDETQVQLPFGDEAAESIRSARQDLARKLGMALDEITVFTVIGEEFSINAFYCRTAKERIARDDPPAVISGLSILLKAAGRRYEYHASGQTVIFCRPLS